MQRKSEQKPENRLGSPTRQPQAARVFLHEVEPYRCIRSASPFGTLKVHRGDV